MDEEGETGALERCVGLEGMSGVESVESRSGDGIDGVYL